ncbi:ribbon-helix-helix domain-containing protein [Rhodocista pekingensis]|uniref:Ribbon-helix-helix domain-containing protein n=1 Tax=Rhodocista pekingensis TaxID=201185 RepID=A0ABW2L1H5_9PROT
MAKRPALGAALKAAAGSKAATKAVEAKRPDPAALATAANPPEERRYVPPPSRNGTAPVTVHLSPEGRKLLRQLALDEDTSVQALMVEAVNMLLAQRGKPEIAAP